MTNAELKEKILAEFPQLNDAIFEQDGVVKIHDESDARIDRVPVIDYYDFPFLDAKEVFHIGGVNRKLAEFVESLGYMTEWINPGCIGIYEA